MVTASDRRRGTSCRFPFPFLTFLFLYIHPAVTLPRCLSAGFTASGSRSGDSLHRFPAASEANTAHRHLHLHVISDDLVSPSLKTKKHYNSFNPKLGFFVPLDETDDVSTERDECPSLRNGCASCRTSRRAAASWRASTRILGTPASHGREPSRTRVVPGRTPVSVLTDVQVE